MNVRALCGCWGLGARALLQVHSDGLAGSVGREKEKDRAGEEGLLDTEERRGMRTRAIAAIVWNALFGGRTGVRFLLGFGVSRLTSEALVAR